MIPPVLDDVTIWQGDSRELIARLPDASVDLICTDPPYNLGGYSTGNIDMAWRKSFNNDVADWDQIAFDPDYDTLPLEHFEDRVRKVFASAQIIQTADD